MAREFPSSVDVIVVGGGSAGAVVAGRLAEDPDLSVLLLEAGPDYGPRDSGRWPVDLLDAAIQPMASHDLDTHDFHLEATHDWGYVGNVHGRTIPFSRAKVMGGCSSHNGCGVVYGSRFDYDGWAAAGNPGWSTDDLAPLFAAAWEKLEVRHISLDQVAPFQAAVADAIAANGIPIVEDFNDFDENSGVAAFPRNIGDRGFRINSAFAYVDPVRDRPNFAVFGDAEVERVVVRSGRVEGVVVRDGDDEVTIGASRVVVSGGAYGSPALLLRSGIGPVEQLRRVGVEVQRDLPGVGENLSDQPSVLVEYSGTPGLVRSQEEFGADHWRPDEEIVAKYPSEECSEGFDLHIYPIGGPCEPPWRPFNIGGAVCRPLSRGSVQLTGPNSSDPLLIDHRYLSDPDGSDLRRLVEVVERIRDIAQESALAPVLGEEVFPGPGIVGREALEKCIQASLVHYYHPVGTCKMGPASDPAAVVDATGAVHGVDGLFVADASIMPEVMSGNTNMPTVVIGEKIGRMLARRG